MRLNALSPGRLLAVILPIGLLMPFGVCCSRVDSTRVNTARFGRYEFVYEQKGVTVRPEDRILDLSADGQWVMDSPKFRKSGFHLRPMWTPPHGTYDIDGDTITFREIVSPGDYRGGPGRPSPIKIGRFQGKDIHIVSLAGGIVTSQSARNPRYEKQP